MIKTYILKISIIAIIIIASTTLNAQTFLGIHGNYNYLRLSSDSAMNKEPIIGMGGGLIFKHFVVPSAGIQIEVNYMQKGWRFFMDEENYYQRNMNYIEIPVLMNAVIGKKKTRVLFLAGLFVDILHDSEISYTNEELIQSFPNQEFVTNELNKLNYGLAGGLGIKRLFSFGTIQIEGRVTQGLSRIMDMPEYRILNYTQNQTFGVSVSYMYYIGKKPNVLHKKIKKNEIIP